MLSLVAAIDKNFAIGIAGEVPWRIAEDLRRFRKLTTGSTVIMGRKTHCALGKLLPYRKNIILTKDPDAARFGALWAESLSQALSYCDQKNEIFIIGGSKVFEEAIKIADRMYITFVDITVEGADAFFPKYNKEDWVLLQETESSSGTSPNCKFTTWERKRNE